MEFRLLGPVEVWTAGRVVELGRPQQRLVMAALAMDAGRAVPVDTLVDRIWDHAPADPQRNLHVLVCRLRQVLEQAGEAVPVVRRSGGYVLEVDPQQVDLLRYRHLVRQARDPDATPADKAPLLRQALQLWLGDPLAGLAGQWAARTAMSLRQQHLDVVVTWAWAEILTGSPGVVVGPLTDLAEEHPLTESLIEVLMQALTATGRAAQALALYRSTRQRLADELGTDPGLALQEAQQQILGGQQRRSRGELGPPPMTPTVVTPEPEMTRPWLEGATYVMGPVGNVIVLTDLRVEHAIARGDGGTGYQATPEAETQQAAATALRDAGSARMTGTIVRHGEPAWLDVRMHGGTSSGTVQWKGSQFDFTLVGRDFYLKADHSAWLVLEAPPAVEGFAGRWVQLRVDQVNFGVVSLDALVAELMNKAWRTGAWMDRAVLDGTKTDVLTQRNGSKLYVKSTGQAYPLRLHRSDGTQLDFTEHGTDFQLRAPADALSNELTATELAWLAAAKDLFDELNDVFHSSPARLTAAVYASLSAKLGGFNSKLDQIGPLSDRLLPVYTIAQRAGVRYARGAECFAVAADLHGRYAGPHTEQRMDEAVQGGFAASAACEDLIDAMNKGDEIRELLSIAPSGDRRHRPCF